MPSQDPLLKNHIKNDNQTKINIFLISQPHTHLRNKTSFQVGYNTVCRSQNNTLKNLRQNIRKIKILLRVKIK